MTEVTDNQFFDPLDDSVEDDDDTYVRPSSRSILRKIFSRNFKTSIIAVREPEKPEPGLYYLNLAQNRADEGRHWISSRELYDPANKFALLNAGINSWGLKMYPDRFKTGFEQEYHRYGGVGAYNEYNDDDDSLIYLVRFHNQEALDQFRLTSFHIPLHLFAPLPVSPGIAEVFADTNEAQLKGWRKRFEGSGFSDDEILGIVNTHHDISRLELLFFGDIATINKAYQYIGGKWAKEWMLRNLREDEE